MLISTFAHCCKRYRIIISIDTKKGTAWAERITLSVNINDVTNVHTTPSPVAGLNFTCISLVLTNCKCTKVQRTHFPQQSLRRHGN